jgi:hypothetical protein
MMHVRTHFVIVTLHNLNVGRNGPQPLVRLPVADVSRAENLLDFARQ